MQLDLIEPPPRWVVHCLYEPYDVFIGRPSDWGNPFVLRREADRPQVLAQYREYLLTRMDLLARLDELRGKRLGCYCAPRACHGDVLAELANRLQ